jgi:hypothetical protein
VLESRVVTYIPGQVFALVFFPAESQMSSATLLSEFDQEMANTRKILECVPADKFGWTPHKKSASLGKLANHLAAMASFADAFIHGQAKRMPETASKAELLEALDKNVATGREVDGATDCSC